MINSQPELVQVVITGHTYPLRHQLKKTGLRWSGKAWQGAIAVDRLDRMRDYCRRHDLQYTITGETIKESRLPRGGRSLPDPILGAVMGEGRLQWYINETLDIERKRSAKNRSRRSR